MQILMNGLVAGLAIAVLSLAFTLVYLPTRVFHLALAAIYVGVPFLAYTIVQRGWPLYCAVLVAAFGGIVASVLCEVTTHGPLDRRNATSAAHLISSLGVYILLVQAIVLVYGSEQRVLRDGPSSVREFGLFALTHAQLAGAITAVTIIVAFLLWLYLTNVGLRFRAIADNPIEMALRGYDLRRLRLLAFGIPGFLTSCVALASAYDVGFEPHSGLQALILAVVAMIIGGRDSFLGPIVAGVLLGVVRACVVWSLSARWQEAATFLLLICFLLLRPRGLLGRKVRREAEQ